VSPGKDLIDGINELSELQRLLIVRCNYIQLLYGIYLGQHSTASRVEMIELLNESKNMVMLIIFIRILKQNRLDKKKFIKRIKILNNTCCPEKQIVGEKYKGLSF